MSHALAFDTYAFVKKLESSGFDEKQAEALSEAIKEVQKTHLEELATKQDILDVKRDMKELEFSLKRDMLDIKRDMKELEVSLKRDMKELESRLIIKLGTLMTVAIGVVAALVKLL